MVTTPTVATLDTTEPEIMPNNDEPRIAILAGPPFDAALADTAGAEVVGELTQQIDRPNSATYLGKGKIDELRDRVAEKEATLVIFDDELTPSQGKNIEDSIATRVVDRAELLKCMTAPRICYSVY